MSNKAWNQGMYSTGRGTFFLKVCFSFFANIFRWVCHMCMKLIFSESPRHGGHFEYPFYGVLTHRKISRAIWISKNTPKMAFFRIFGYGYPYEIFAKNAIFLLFFCFQITLEALFWLKMCYYRYSKCSPWIALSNKQYFTIREYICKRL